MFLLREDSANSADPLFLRFPTSPVDYREKQLVLFPEVSVAKWFYESGIAERALINWTLENLIKEDKNFVDVGAHIGTYSWICGRKAKHTYAFECDPKTFCYLAANVALHQLEDKISLFNTALGAHEQGKTAILYKRSEDGGGNGIKLLSDKDVSLTKTIVSVKPLDDFELDEIGLIKIDVEGNELEVLKGAQRTLEKNNFPPILFESWGDWKEREGIPARKIKEELFSYLISMGYVVSTITGARDMFLASHARSG